MAREKRASDEVYNARRRIRRAARAAEKKGETERARQLRLLAESTYIGRGVGASVERAARAAVAALKRIPRTKEERREERERKSAVKQRRERFAKLISVLRGIGRGAGGGVTPRGAARNLAKVYVDRDNKLFAHELNLASSDMPSSIDRPDLSGRSQARIFWMSTRKLWIDAKPDKRYEAILKGMHADSLREAFNLVLKYNKKAVASAEKAEKEVRDTLAEMGDERGDEPVSIGSPPEFAYFVRDITARFNLLR